jgi:TRAP-type uncharacterized transport system fused permease subunit
MPNIRSIVFATSGLLVLAGAILYLTQWSVSPWLFAVGAAGIAVYHLTMPVRQLSTRARRLQTFNVIGGLAMVVASVFMFRRENEWIICLTIAAILHVYAAFVAPKDK